MTKEQFDAGIGEFYDKEAITKVYALIGPREDDAYMIIDEWGERYQECKGGLLIDQGKTFHYLPYETIIALTGMCAAQDYKF